MGSIYHMSIKGSYNKKICIDDSYSSLVDHPFYYITGREAWFLHDEKGWVLSLYILFILIKSG